MGDKPPGIDFIPATDSDLKRVTVPI